MPAPTIETVIYPPPESINGHFIVQRIPGEVVLRYVAGPVRELIRRSYAHSYEQPNGPLPRGTVDTRYDESCHARFYSRALEHFREGSAYWVALSEGQGSKLIGFAKTTPNYPTKGIFYLNDVVVDPRPRPESGVSSQRRGYGTMLVHAALKYGGYEDWPLQLEAYELNEGEGGPNEMYRNMGMVRVGGAEPFKFPNGSQLEMCLYSTPPGATIADVVETQEARYDHLGEAFASTVSYLNT